VLKTKGIGTTTLTMGTKKIHLALVCYCAFWDILHTEKQTNLPTWTQQKI